MDFFIVAAAAAAVAPGAMGAQVAPPVAAETGVTSYPPSFFVESLPNTAADMVSRVPGFAIDNGGNARGLSGTAGNVLIDGERPSSKSETVQEVLSRIPAGQVVRIDLIRGGAPGIDMQGKAVVANVIRAKGGGFTGSATVGAYQVLNTDRRTGSVDLEGAREFALGSINGALAYDTGSGNDRVTNNRLRLDPSGVSLINSASFNRGTSSELDGTAGAEFKLLGGEGGVNGQMFKADQDGADTEIFRTPGSTRFATNQGRRTGGEVGGNYQHRLGTKAKIEAVFLDSWRDNQSESSSTSGATVSGTTRKEKSGETVGRAILTLQPSSALSLEMSGEGAFNFLDGASSLVIGGVTSAIPNSAARIEETRGEVGSVLTWRTQGNLTLQAALRYEASTLSARGKEKSLRFAKPLVQATWQAGPRRQVRLRVERTVGQLDFGDFLSSASLGTGIVTAGASDLTPTQTWTMLMLYEQQFWDKGSLRFSLRHDRLDDVIDRMPVTSGATVFDATGNIGKGAKAIFAANLVLPVDRFGIPGGRLTLDGQWRFQSRVSDPSTGAMRRISGDGAYSYGLQFSQDITRWRSTWGFSGNMQARNVNYRRDGRDISSTTPLLSAFINYKPRPDTSLRLDLQNLLARRFETVREVYAGPRHATPLTYNELRRQETERSIRMSLRRSIG